MKKPIYLHILIVVILCFIAIIALSNPDYWYARVPLCMLFGLAISIHIWQANKHEQGHSSVKKSRPRFAPYIQPWLFPLFVGLYLILSLLVGFSETIDSLFPNLARLFLHISIYNAILLLLLPFLRKRFSARVCATLWILPNILYFAYNPLIEPPQPLLIIPFPFENKCLLLIWLIGLAVTFLYQIINHLLFRRKILKNAQRIWDMDIHRIWCDTLEEGQFRKKDYPLMRSGDIPSPLSIGFFPKTVRVILPMKEYTPEELRLILRHEAIHIGRQDSFIKFFLTFCACVCWFNPIAWIAIHRCSADMELSCDETVLLNEPQETKQLYAELLLKTAGDDRGFSTCLSASAKTMRYRLTRTLKPEKRYLGAIAAGITLFLLLSTCGLVAIRYSQTTATEAIFDSEENTAWFSSVIYKANGQDTEYTVSDITPILEYISSIPIYQLAGGYAYPDDDARIIIGYQKTDYKNNYASTGVISNGFVELLIKDHNIIIIDFATGGPPKITTYYHNETIDWDYLLTLCAVGS